MWKFQPGDDLRWAEPTYDDQDWTPLQVPKSGGRQGYANVFGVAWYRTRVALPWPADAPIGIALGKIDSAYEVVVGGRKLGGVGRLPPLPEMEYDRHAIYVVPPSTRAPDGSVTIALRVWRADLAKARRRPTSFALAMIDIDHFKTINDAYGHTLGDRVLTHVARRLAEGVRESDDVGRWGGEEFLVLLADANLAEAEAAAGRLRQHVESSVCEVDGRTLSVTVSIGVAMLDATRLESAGLDDLIRTADEALYLAKAEGRNRVAHLA